MVDLDTEIKYLKGIGPKRAQVFGKLGIKTVEDVLTFFPIRYQDRTNIVCIRDTYENSQSCIFGRIGKTYEQIFSGGLCILDIEIFDSTSVAYARFFRNKRSYWNIDIFASIKKVFKPGTFAYIYGAVVKIELIRRFIVVDDYEIVRNENDKPLMFRKIVPVYSATERLSQKFIRETVKNVLELACGLYPDISTIIPDSSILTKLSSPLAIWKIHYPDTLDGAENARRAFALQEFSVLESAISLSRSIARKNFKTQKYEVRKTLLTAFKNKLKFKFTREQKKAINEIFSDMRKTYPMNRILVGDVGSGKTVVALSAVLLAVENGYQAMIIAPTEILAEQHYINIVSILSGVDVKTILITSSTLKNKIKREKMLLGFESDDIKIAVGTLSLVESRIKFKNLSLIVIDEQHRFGVMQKFAALVKAQSPDVLMMSATPIPRTLSMTAYGEMNITAIKELPPGRIPVKTYSLDEQSAYKNTIEELKKGNQAYVVYPIADESDKLALKSAVQESERLSRTWFKDFKVGLLYGKMKLLEKSEIMHKFKNKEFDVLISTSIVEIGINVPNATVMIVQHADRFGLSELHQLRGRIGRSSKQSYAYLINTSKSEKALKRLSIITSMNNGFKIAEEDLKMRGPGELIGTAQCGFIKFKAGDFAKDADIIKFAKNFASKIIEDDPNLSKNENAVLKKLICKRFSDKIRFIDVG